MTASETTATAWKCSLRTVIRWRKSGAPLADQAAMCRWLAGQRTLPTGTRALLGLTTCACCGNQIHPPIRRKVCSDECALKIQRQQRDAWGIANRKVSESECEVCGSTFIGHGARKTCSKECARERALRKRRRDNVNPELWAKRLEEGRKWNRLHPRPGKTMFR